MTQMVCGACGGYVRRMRKLDYAGVPRFWDVCLVCHEASWDMAVAAHLYAAAQRRKAARREATTVSGYSLDPQDSCACYRTDSRDCHTGGCFAVPGQRDWVERVAAGEYDAEAEAQAERECLDGYDPELSIVGFERLVRS